MGHHNTLANQIVRNMASFAKHLSLLLLTVLLSDSVGRSYGRDSFYFSKVAPNSVDKENDVADLFDHDEPAFSQLSKQQDHSNGDDEKLTISLRAYEQGIKYAELVKNKMNSYGVKAINNNGFNDDGDYSLNDALTAYARGVKIAKSATSKDIKDDEDAAAAADDEKLTKSLRAYGQGIKYAELVKNKMNSYGVKAVNNYDNNDDGDNSLNNAWTAYARGGKIAKWVMSKDIKDAAAAAADNSLNNALTAYARGVEIAKSIKNNDVDVNDINNSEKETYQQWVKAYNQWINQAKSVKNENAEDDVHGIVDIKDPKIKAAYEQGVKYAKYLNDEDMP